MADLQRAESGLTRQDVIRGPELFLVTAFISLALYNFMELNALIFTTFKKRRGVYFWSMLAATWGVALNAIGYLLKFLLPSSSTALDVISTILVLAGWCAMITGQSVVLYSRLHLLVYDHFTIRLVLAMIIIDAAICHPPTISLFCLINNTRNPDPFIPAYSIYEKVQLFIFFIQEFVISAIYIIESAKFLRSRKGMSGGNGQLPPSSGGVSLTDSNRMIMYWLISVNVLVVLLDVSILALELSGYYDLQTSWVSEPVDLWFPGRFMSRQTRNIAGSYDCCPIGRVMLTTLVVQKAFVYSLKLKLEFCILNKLIAVVKTRESDLVHFVLGPSEILPSLRLTLGAIPWPVIGFQSPSTSQPSRKHFGPAM